MKTVGHCLRRDMSQIVTTRIVYLYRGLQLTTLNHFITFMSNKMVAAVIKNGELLVTHSGNKDMW